MLAQRDKSLSFLKLSAEVVLIIVFTSTALLRSVDTKVELVGTCVTADDLTAEDRYMPDVLSIFMVLFSVGLPFGTLVYTRVQEANAAADNEEKKEVEGDAGHNIDVTHGVSGGGSQDNPLHEDEDGFIVDVVA